MLTSLTVSPKIIAITKLREATTRTRRAFTALVAVFLVFDIGLSINIAGLVVSRRELYYSYVYGPTTKVPYDFWSDGLVVMLTTAIVIAIVGVGLYFLAKQAIKRLSEQDTADDEYRSIEL